MLDDLVAWLAAGGITSVGINWMPDEPDEIAVVSVVGGLPPAFEGAFEPTHIQMHARATTDATAEALARSVHTLVNGVTNSFQMGATYILSAEPQGPPMFAGRDAKNRTIYAGTFLFTVAT